MVRMNDVDIGLFQFDYDLTWMAFTLNCRDQIYSRYGGRDATSEDGRLSIAGLNETLRRSLRLHQTGAPNSSKPRRSPVFPIDLFTVHSRSCLHCHQIWEGIRARDMKAGTLVSDSLDVYPLPENIGITLNVDDGTLIDNVSMASAAWRAGLRIGDKLERVHGVRVLSQADVSWALHNAPAQGTLEIEFTRGIPAFGTTLALHAGWRKTDTSWRKSMH
jgi:hypothetical protein